LQPQRWQSQEAHSVATAAAAGFPCTGFPLPPDRSSNISNQEQQQQQQEAVKRRN